jgi:methylenetetrahydrofolate dehydrogenase (NADP+)/methenyltetrahydrofolate cyclohydrolase
MVLIDGKEISAIIKTEIAEEVTKIVSEGLKAPHLAAILVGHDGGSETYVAAKVKACELVGFESTLIRFEDNVSEEELLDCIHSLNQNPEIDGFIVQLPLPKHISEEMVIENINPKKDVDGFHPVNVGRVVAGMPAFVSATPFGIMELLRRYKIETKGKSCAVIGRSNIVGRPMSILLSQKGVDCTVTLCHSRTKNLKEICLNSDIIVAALGMPEFLTGDMVKEGAVVIDVGTTRVASDQTKSGFKLKGDVKFDEVAPKCSFITPVPGGVGPMTIASLLYNTLLSNQHKIYK